MSDAVPGIRIERDADLRRLNTFGVAARAAWLVEIDDASQLSGALSRAPLAGRRPLVLGGGSNVLFVDDPVEPVLRLTGRATRLLEDGRAPVLFADAGVDWHALVMESLDLGLAGLENLALIPGTVGAAPIQNIGAYGVEVQERIEAVHVFDFLSGCNARVAAAECGFAYRDSNFKRMPNRWIITGVEFRLLRGGQPQVSYAGLGEELTSRGIASPTARDVADAVIAIRRRKLPDPAVIGNAGSFFKNPIVPVAVAEALQAQHPQLPVFAAGAARKISAAWLIDSLGFKGYRDGDAGVADSHALVLVNQGHATGRQLFDVAQRVAYAVRERYGVELEPEPRLVGATWP